jgi:hypothetical protein
MYKNVKKILVAAVVLIALDLGFMNLNKNLYTSTVVNIQRVVVVPKYAGFVWSHMFLFWQPSTGSFYAKIAPFGKPPSLVWPSTVYTKAPITVFSKNGVLKWP